MKRIFFLGVALLSCFVQPGTCDMGHTGGVREPDDDSSIDIDAWVELDSCDDLREGLLIPSGAKVVFCAKDHLVISGVQIHVAPGARLSLMSEKGVFLTKTKAMGDVPVRLAGGDLEVSSGQHVPGGSKFTETLFLKPQQEQEGLIVRKDFGTVYASSGQEVLFDENMVIVGDEIDRVSEIAPQKVDETKDLPTGPEHEPSEPTTDHLKHGQSLRGRSLVSIDGAAKVRLGMYGSVFFARYPAAEKLEVSEDGKTSSPMELDTLIRADPSKVERAMKIRSKLATEASGGKHANKNVLAWTPWVRRYNRQVDMARQHSGEVDMTIDDNGCLKATVDGFCVMSRSGPHSWEWMNRFSFRKKNPGYELHIVENGVEVRLDSKKVWGVTLPEKKKEYPYRGTSIRSTAFFTLVR